MERGLMTSEQVFNTVEIKPEMTGHYLAEFSCSYKPVKHGRPGIGATHCKLYLLMIIF
jgi:small subunit ribosomal protein S15e